MLSKIMFQIAKSFDKWDSLSHAIRSNRFALTDCEQELEFATLNNKSVLSLAKRLTTLRQKNKSLTKRLENTEKQIAELYERWQTEKHYHHSPCLPIDIVRTISEHEQVKTYTGLKVFTCYDDEAMPELEYNP